MHIKSCGCPYGACICYDGPCLGDLAEKIAEVGKFYKNKKTGLIAKLLSFDSKGALLETLDGKQKNHQFKIRWCQCVNFTMMSSIHVQQFGRGLRVNNDSK